MSTTWLHFWKRKTINKEKADERKMCVCTRVHPGTNLNAYKQTLTVVISDDEITGNFHVLMFFFFWNDWFFMMIYYFYNQKNKTIFHLTNKRRQISQPAIGVLSWIILCCSVCCGRFSSVPGLDLLAAHNTLHPYPQTWARTFLVMPTVAPCWESVRGRNPCSDSGILQPRS